MAVTLSADGRLTVDLITDRSVFLRVEMDRMHKIDRIPDGGDGQTRGSGMEHFATGRRGFVKLTRTA
jgi:hypothetical protein